MTDLKVNWNKLKKGNFFIMDNLAMIIGQKVTFETDNLPLQKFGTKVQKVLLQTTLVIFDELPQIFTLIVGKQPQTPINTTKFPTSEAWTSLRKAKCLGKEELQEVNIFEGGYISNVPTQQTCF